MAMIENAMTSPVIYLAILDAFLPFLPSEWSSSRRRSSPPRTCTIRAAP
ncbi:hypothetical protein [Verrucosispora sp. WMMD573]|nr:hypothetical protein [Verrucosispora sp. WMMD573]WBB55648.1 hypothetical protein O7601_05960 [Verrucosispora sp. WMMD573]